MFCSKCGGQFEDGASFCPNCGNTVTPEPHNTTGVKFSSAAISEKLTGFFQSFDLKNPKSLGMAIAAVVVVVLLASMLFGGQSYKSAVNSFMDGVFDADAKQLLRAFPNKVIDEMCDEADMSKREMIDYINDELDDAIDMLDSYVDEDWSVDYKIIGTESYDSDDLEWVEEEYDEIGIKIKDAKMVTVEMTIESDDMSESEELEIGVIKVGNSWYVDAQNVDMPF
mgnify:CR=1 FL=1